MSTPRYVLLLDELRRLRLADQLRHIQKVLQTSNRHPLRAAPYDAPACAATRSATAATSAHQ